MKEKFLPFYVLSEIYALLDKKHRKGLLVLFFGIILTGIFDLLGLAAILGILGLATAPEKIFETPQINAIYEFLDFQSSDSFVIFLVCSMLGLFLFKTILGVSIIYQQKNFAFSLTETIVARMFSYYFSSDSIKPGSIDTGNLITNIRIVPIHYVIQILQPVITLMSEIFVSVSIVIAIAFLDIRLLFFLVIILGLAFVLIYRSLKNKSYQLGQKIKVLGPESLRIITEAVMGIIPIKMTNNVRFFKKRFVDQQHEEYHARKWAAFYGEIPSRMNELLMVFGIFSIFLYGFIFIDDQGAFLVMMGTLAVSGYRMMPSINRILQSMVTVKKGQYLIEILSVLRSYEPPKEESTEKLLLKEDVKFENISFAFEKDKKILKDISFEVKKGQQIGIIGESGSGKTTLMKILLRLVEEDLGAIWVDGFKLNDENKKNWQRNIGYVQQEPFLVDDSLSANIAFGVFPEERDKAKILRSLELAKLDEFAKSLPKGIDSRISEYGSNLSGGQKQRIAIARAIYMDAEVFIFDEATSALDAETESGITESMQELKSIGKTVFIIAHRLTTLKGCDKIYELDSGRITREYSYHEMIKEKLGLVEEEL